jgi:WD40 repeat protein
MWDMSTGQEILVLKGHTSWISGLAFSLAGNQLVSAAADKTVRSWDGTPLVDPGKDNVSGHAELVARRRAGLNPRSGYRGQRMSGWKA